jgi:hypothetical protein
MMSPQLCNGLKFPSIKVFREAVRESNIKNEKDIMFKKIIWRGALWYAGNPIVRIGFMAVNAMMKRLLRLDQFKPDTHVQGNIGFRL